MTERCQLLNAARRIERLRSVVEKAGARYLGIQEGDAALHLDTLVLFTNSYNSTLALRIQNVSVESVQKRISESEAEFQKTDEKVLQEIAW